MKIKSQAHSNPNFKSDSNTDCNSNLALPLVDERLANPLRILVTNGIGSSSLLGLKRAR
jgi:hypothetical protein